MSADGSAYYGGLGLLFEFLNFSGFSWEQQREVWRSFVLQHGFDGEALAGGGGDPWRTSLWAFQDLVLNCLGRAEYMRLDSAAFAFIDEQEPALLRPFVRFRDLLGWTALHNAAWNGQLNLCKKFLDMGALPNAKYFLLGTPLDVAREKGHREVANFLASCSTLTAVRGGCGDALDAARADNRPVSRVEWFTMPLSAPVGCHSLLCVTVSGGASDEHAYVIEKAASHGGCEHFKHGVYISHWKDVRAQIQRRATHTLERMHLRTQEITLWHLREIAVDMGPYDLGTCNCHHAAMAVFNACAKAGSRVRWMPDAGWTWVARTAKAMLGIDMGNFRSRFLSPTLSASLPSSEVVSASRPIHYKHGAFPLGSDEAGSNPWAVTAGSLSAWIYHPGDPALPEARVLHTERTGNGNCVQWSVATASDTAYVTFRGTDEPLDAIIDLGFLTASSVVPGVRVHSSMQAALHQRADAVDEIEARLRALSGSVRCVVVCGHSLGGGYALIAALELLHRGKVRPSAVLTFGAPQAVVRSPNAPAWQRLDAITTNFVNSYDCVPRLLSCMPWVDALAGKSGKGTAVRLEVHFESSPLKEARDYLAQAGYGVIGALVFVAAGSRSVRRVPSSEEESQRAWLEALPDPMGDFVVEQHDMAVYLGILRCLFTTE